MFSDQGQRRELMTRLFAIVQTGIRDVGMKIETLPRHVQCSRIREGCWKTLKTLRIFADEHQNSKKEQMQGPNQETRVVGMLVSAQQC